MLFTTNKPLGEWGKVLHDEDLAAASWIVSSSGDVLSSSMALPGAPVI